MCYIKWNLCCDRLFNVDKLVNVQCQVNSRDIIERNSMRINAKRSSIDCNVKACMIHFDVHLEDTAACNYWSSSKEVVHSQIFRSFLFTPSDVFHESISRYSRRPHSHMECNVIVFRVYVFARR